MIPQFFNKIFGHLKDQYSIDGRSISLFRISLGVVLLIDILLRIPEIGSFYTDNGVLPRYVELTNTVNHFKFSIHHAFGSIFGQVLIFVLHLFVTTLFIFGHQTKLTTFILWVLTSSLHSRNYLVLQSGDTALRLFIFWSLFLPIHGNHSFDTYSKKLKLVTNKFFNVGTLAIFSQIAIIYFFAGYEKSYESYFLSGDALRLAMNLERYATTFGHSLLAFPEFLKFGSRFSYLAELLCPIFLFFPFKNWIFRSVILFCFLSFHIGTVFMMEVGFFPFISITMWILLIPSQAFDYLKKFKKINSVEVSIGHQFYNLPFRALLIMLNLFEVKIHFSNETNEFKINNKEASKDELINLIVRHSLFYTPWTARILRFFMKFTMELNQLSFSTYKSLAQKSVTAIGCLLLLYNVVLNLRPLKNLSSTSRKIVQEVEGFDLLKHGLNFEQRWGMFSPEPSRSDGWHIIYGERYNGAKVDLWGTDFRTPLEKPESVAATYRNQRWRKYLDTVVRETHKGYRPYFLQHICYEINKYKKNPLMKLKKVYHRFTEELTLENNEVKINEIDYGSVTCLK